MYGWFLKHKRTGYFVRVEGGEYTAHNDIRRATRFETQADACEANVAFQAAKMTLGIELEVIDATIPTEPTPDADPIVDVPSRDDILKAAHEAGANRRAAHDAARAAFNEQPSGVLLPHPGSAAPKKNRTTAKKQVRK